VISLIEWIRMGWTDRPWLIFGKGPSFARHVDHDLTGYYKISMNHAVREVAVDVAHFIDLDAAVASADGIRQNAQWLMLPLYPHMNFRPSDRPLPELVDDEPILREFRDRGRLIWYYHLPDGSGLEKRYPADAAPIIRVNFFSVEAVVNVLAAAGSKVVRTLGVDGGSLYSNRFHDLKTCLANGQPSFDRQFIGVLRTAEEQKMDFGPLEPPIRVFVGTEPNQQVPFQVLEYSIRRFCSRPVEVIPVTAPEMPPDMAKHRGSFSRFLVPKLCDYKGRAIYLEANSLVFGDLAEIWELPLDRSCAHCCAGAAGGRSMEVLLLDCSRLRWEFEAILGGLEAGKNNVHQLLNELCLVPPDLIGEGIDPTWNSRDHFEIAATRLLRYTDPSSYPWRANGHPFGTIWRAYYRQAVEVGAVDPSAVEAGIKSGHLMIDLAYDLRQSPVKQSLVDAALLGAGSAARRRADLERAALAAEVGVLREHMADTSARALASDQAAHELRRQVDHLQHQVVSLERNNGQLVFQVGTLTRRINDLTNEMEPLTNRLAQLTHELGSLSREIGMLRLTLENTYNSWSWKIGRGVTKPLRLARGVLHRMRLLISG
jgi:hypothetical protein